MRRRLAAALLAAAVGCGDAPPPAAPPKPTAAAPAPRCPVCDDEFGDRTVEVALDGAVRTTCSQGCAVRLRTSPEKFAGR